MGFVYAQGFGTGWDDFARDVRRIADSPEAS
jgi:hypothetical protein